MQNPLAKSIAVFFLSQSGLGLSSNPPMLSHNTDWEHKLISQAQQSTLIS